MWHRSIRLSFGHVYVSWRSRRQSTKYVIRWILINQFGWHAVLHCCTTGMPEPPWQLEKQENSAFYIHGNLSVKWVQSCVVRCSASSHCTLLISVGLTVNTPLMFAKYASMVVYACKERSAPPSDLLCVCVPAFHNCHAFVRLLERRIWIDDWMHLETGAFNLSYLWWHIILSSTGNTQCLSHSYRKHIW